MWYHCLQYHVDGLSHASRAVVDGTACGVRAPVIASMADSLDPLPPLMVHPWFRLYLLLLHLHPHHLHLRVHLHLNLCDANFRNDM